MKTMHLFAGIGGGLYADLILGHDPIAAIENNQGPSAPSAGAGWYCPQRDLFNIMPPFSAKWSKSGMIVDGQYYPLKRLALHILEKDGGACVPVPTPTRVDATSRTYHKQKDGTVRLSLAGYARMYPTPTARDWRHVSKGDMLRHTLSLAAIVPIQAALAFTLLNNA